jgi:hypothetical protein
MMKRLVITTALFFLLASFFIPKYATAAPNDCCTTDADCEEEFEETCTGTYYTCSQQGKRACVRPAQPPEPPPSDCPGGQMCASVDQQTCEQAGGTFRPCTTPDEREGTCCFTPPAPPEGCCYPYGDCPEDEKCQISGDYLCSRQGLWTCVKESPPLPDECGDWIPAGGGHCTVPGGLQCPNNQAICCNPREKCPGYVPSSPPPSLEDITCEVGGKQGIETAIGCVPFEDANAFVGFLLRWGIGIGGGIAFLLILVAGFLIMTSTGDPKKVQAGKELLTAAITGLLLLIFSVFILEFIGVDILGIPGFGD